MMTIVYACLVMAYLSIGYGLMWATYESIKVKEPHRVFSLSSYVSFLAIVLLWPFIILAGLAKGLAKLGDR